MTKELRFKCSVCGREFTIKTNYEDIGAVNCQCGGMAKRVELKKVVRCPDCRFEDDYDEYYSVKRYCPQCGAILCHSAR